MVNDTRNKVRHWLSATLVLVAIAASVPLRVEALAISGETPEFLRGETRPKSVALLPPQGPDQRFAKWAGHYVEKLLTEKGYTTQVITVDQLNADPHLQELVLQATKRLNVERGMLRGKSPGGQKKLVGQRQLRLGTAVSSLASKLKVDGAVFAPFAIAPLPQGRALVWLTVFVVNGMNGDIEAYFYDQVQFWQSPNDAMKTIVEKMSEDFPAAAQSIKAKGATLDTPPSSLQVAARWGDLDQVQRFLAKGTNINAVDEDEGNAPLHWATVAGEKAVVEVLIAKGAKVDAKNKRGNTPLSLAAVTDYEAIAQLLIAKGANVNAQNKKRSSPLMLAAFAGHKDVAEVLIAKGAKVDAKNKKGITPLSGAAATGHRDVAELLIAKGADVNAEDKLYNTPLHWAAVTGRWEVAELLIAKGADVNAENIDHETPLTVAMSRRHEKFAELLKQHGGKESK
jgi:ankyrin repeat protein